MSENNDDLKEMFLELSKQFGVSKVFLYCHSYIDEICFNLGMNLHAYDERQNNARNEYIKLIESKKTCPQTLVWKGLKNEN